MIHLPELKFVYIFTYCTFTIHVHTCSIVLFCSSFLILYITDYTYVSILCNIINRNLYFSREFVARN